MIKIVDYGMGNLRSVQKAFEHIGAEAQFVTRPAEADGAQKLVLPGVGAFRDAIHELQRTGLDQPVREHIASGKPFLGICLGLQLLFDVSYEDGQWEGLGVLPGKVVRFADQPDLKIPHMGWNSLEFAKPTRLFEGVPAGSSFYFVHKRLCRAGRRIGDRRPHRAWHALCFGRRPQQFVRDPVPSGKEPEPGPALAAEFRGSITAPGKKPCDDSGERSMEILPAIDLRGGQCVRLRQGDYKQETVFGDPLEMARRFVAEGATRLHLVDLDGARAGRPVNH